MREISFQNIWSVFLTDEQYKVGKDAVLQKGATHFTVFCALKSVGVPVRKKGMFPASQAATAFQYQYRVGEL